MAKQIITRLTDDLDGADADETIAFGIDGRAYEIDLSAANATKLRELLNPYQQAGSHAGKFDTRSAAQGFGPSRNPGTKRNFLANRELNHKIREWANQSGYSLAERGRIPQHIVDAFHRGESNPVQTLAVVEPEPQPEPEPTKVVPVRRTRQRPAAAKAK